MRRLLAAAIFAALLLPLAAACSGDSSSSLTIYAGRSSTLVDPILKQFAKETGIHVRVRYGDSTELASTILEEGKNSPADIFYGQDAGSLGALLAANRLTPLPGDLLQLVPEAYRSPQGLWVGISGRARVAAYNTDKLSPSDLPASVLGYSDARWKGRVGYVPPSDGFPDFVTGLRLILGEDAARAWLQAFKANNPKAYPNNLAALQAVADGEVDVALVNHYYLLRSLQEHGQGFKARNYYFSSGDPGGLINVAGAGILDTAGNREYAERFLRFLLSAEAQQYFAESTFEYPLAAGVAADPQLPPLSQLQPPKIDLTRLSDLQGSLKLMREVGLLP
ncbi:MAG TPA: iron ABC transporter substrate-binding protein [Dehalococcoidia bacterium]|nr:iron ABC transporter substrate-binding protein [Dehalococcoidia bacterium]